MNYEQLLASITPDIYRRLRDAVALGKWPDGKPLTDEQKQTCIQAVITWEHQHLPPEEHTGYIAPKPHSHCGGDGEVADANEPKPLKWTDA
ncbi:YeaC family protein [Marinimicrobium alkaliphilum]|uniref:YeaC family protein n=1 Tax=Marinimicrobium alkaliphilum TaxID=2202654 RepID=UPI000DBAC4FE|nr:DUF1315 family protein [Marinimicrobium alkaliphilum]